jgi:hypothetical protein
MDFFSPIKNANRHSFLGRGEFLSEVPVPAVGIIGPAFGFNPGLGQPQIFKLNGVRVRHEMKEAAN